MPSGWSAPRRVAPARLLEALADVLLERVERRERRRGERGQDDHGDHGEAEERRAAPAPGAPRQHRATRARPAGAAAPAATVLGDRRRRSRALIISVSDARVEVACRARSTRRFDDDEVLREEEHGGLHQRDSRG